MRSITGNKLASYKPKQDVFASLHELTKQNTIETGRSFISIKNVLGEKNRKIN